MPIDKYNQADLMNHLYNGTGMLGPIRLLKRGPDQKQGTVTAYIFNGCRHSVIQRQGQTLTGTLSSKNSTIWHIPMKELRRVGIQYLTALDRLVDLFDNTGTWQPEANTEIKEKLLLTHVCVYCLGVDK